MQLNMLDLLPSDNAKSENLQSGSYKSIGRTFQDGVTSENLPQAAFSPRQVFARLIVYRADSRVNRTALRDAVKRLLTNVTFGRKCGASFAKLSRDGSWMKTCGGYCQAKMDGSFEEYSGTLPQCGMMLHGELFQLPPLEQVTGGKEYSLLPTPTANLYMGYDATTAKKFLDQGTRTAIRPSGIRVSQFLNNYAGFLPAFSCGMENRVNPSLLETMMGFPNQWTEIER